MLALNVGTRCLVAGEALASLGDARARRLDAGDLEAGSRALAAVFASASLRGAFAKDAADIRAAVGAGGVPVSEATTPPPHDDTVAAANKRRRRDAPNEVVVGCARLRRYGNGASAGSSPREAASPQPPASAASDGTATSARRRPHRRATAVLSLLGDAASLNAARAKRLEFKRSPIHAWGVFAAEPIKEGEFILEYMGELIPQVEADRREAEYHSRGLPDYMFRIDDETICDATMMGSIARFLNHSCAPNAFTRIVKHENTKKIGIYAKRDVAEGEELCYDYKFPIEDVKIPCHCGAEMCRRYLN